MNNDLGEPITEQLKQPVGLREYKEGGSYDFFIEHSDKKILIRPSFNYIKGQLDDIDCDVLFLGVAGLAKADQETEKTFFSETVEKNRCQTCNSDPLGQFLFAAGSSDQKHAFLCGKHRESIL